jgi:hypothetical protein
VASQLSIWTVMAMASECENEGRLMSWAEKVMDIWDHLVWVIGPLMATCLTCL